MNFHVVTLFPDSLDSYLKSSIIGRAIKIGKLKIKAINVFDFLLRQHERPDDRPYAGGPGMVLRAEPLLKAVEKVTKKLAKKPKIIIFSPSGKQFDNEMAAKLAKEKDIILIAGRYEGLDARVGKILRAEEISIGPYVLTGGELPALVVMDAVARQIPGVLGKLESLEESRTASPEVYTRPEVLIYKKKKYRVPKVLLSGNHKNIEEWRQEKLKKSEESL